MKRKFLIPFILVDIVVLLVVAYFGIGYVLYNKLTDIKGACPNASKVNTPANFVDTTHYWRDDFDYTPYFMPNYENVRINSRQEGIELEGWYIPADADLASQPAPTVIVVHGLRGCMYSMTELTPAGMLSHAGFNVLLIDMRDVVGSTYEDGRSAIGNEEFMDVLGAWNWLRSEKQIPAAKIGIVGNSLGAATALIAFSQEPQVAAVFVDSPFDNLPQIIREELELNNYPQFLEPAGIIMAKVVAGDDLLAHNPYEAITKSNGRPVFILHGTADERINYRHTLQLQERAKEIGADNVTVWIIDGIGHVDAASTNTAEYQEKLITFFSNALGKPMP